MAPLKVQSSVPNPTHVYRPGIESIDMGEDDSVPGGHTIKCVIETKTQILALISVLTFGSEKGLQESFWSCLIFFFSEEDHLIRELHCQVHCL